VTQDRAGELGEEALDEVEPRAVLGGESELEAASRPSGEPSVRLLGNVRGMIVENQFDRGAGRIGGIEKLEEFDELPAAVAISDEGMDLPGEQIDPGQQAECAMALVLMITREGGVEARAPAANRARSLRWPGFPVFRHRTRSLLACAVS
jgi:hypothetical protein